MQNGAILELAETIDPINAATPGAAVYERFEREPDTMAIAVVDDDARPVGIIERNAFFLAMAAQYGRALYAHRPIRLLMNARPLIVEGRTRTADFCGQALAERPSELLHGFVVTTDGRYAGVGSALSLLQATNAASRAHAEEMTELAERLSAAQEAAQASLKAKGQFLASMSHEIRTPLNGVIAVAELLQRKLADAELRPYVGAIVDSGQILMRLLGDALDLTRAEAGRLDLVAQTFEIEGLLHDLETLWGARAEQKGLNLKFRYDGEAGLNAVGDPMRLKQVFNNLISNALKFTDRGRVTVRVAATTSAGGVRFEGQVSDTGVGMSDEFLGRIFTPFSQSDEGVARGGAGLGLAVCREIVVRMNGQIRAARNAEGGSVVDFDAALAPATIQAIDNCEPGETESAGWGLRILVADDNPTNRLVATALCDLVGCVCSTVNDGVAAVAAAATGAFDLVLMDIKMPRLDGLAAMRQIRALPGAVAFTPIIALTANADPTDAARYRAAGMDGVVAKPIKPEALYAAIHAAMEIKAPASTAVAG